MEHYSHQSILPNPLGLSNPLKHPKIKPLVHINSKANPIDQEHLHKYLRSHSNTFKTLHSNLSQQQNLLISRKNNKNFLKIFQIQSHLSNLSHHLLSSRPFQNLYFSSKIKNFSALSSLELKFEGELTFSKQLHFATKNLGSLKELVDFQIRFTFYNLRGSLELRGLFKRLLYLPNLTSFSFEMISCRHFEVADFKAFFSALSKLTQLQVLKLSFFNSLHDKNPCIQTLIPVLSSLNSLTQIDLNFGGSGSIQAENLVKLFIALGRIKTLTNIMLNLPYCSIDNENSTNEPLSEGLLCVHPSLIRKFCLYPYENLEDGGLLQIFQTLKRFTSLEILDLDLTDFEQIMDEDIAELGSTLKSLGSLTSLSLSLASFQLVENTVPSIASAFKSWQNLVYLKLDLSGICITDPDQIQLFSSSLKTVKSSLKFLDLDFSERLLKSNLTVQILSEAVKELALLKHLSLNFDGKSMVTNKGLEALSFAVQDLPFLSYLALNLANNQEINNITPLSQALRKIPSLNSVKLDFGRCKDLKYEGNGLQSLFSSLREMNNIGEIHLNIVYSEEIEEEINRLKRRKYVSVFWRKN